MSPEELKDVRLSLGLTRKDMSKKTGYSEIHIYMMETGRRSVSDRVEKLVNLMKKGAEAPRM